MIEKESTGHLEARIETPPLLAKTHAVYYHIEQMGRTYPDQIGWFLVTSRRGNKYIMIIHDFDSNGILSEPLISRIAKVITKVFDKLHDHLKSRCCKLLPYIR